MSTNLTSLDPRKFVVVDLDSGTIVGTNVVLVPLAAFPVDDYSDSEIIGIASEHGVTLCTQD